MCIIVAKEKGQPLPSDEILRECFKCNHDGAGYMYHGMYKNKPKVIIKKGFMDIESLLGSLHDESFTNDSTVVIHFRIGTSGAIDETCTHPFPLTHDVDKLIKTRVVCNIGVTHNGVFGKGEDKLSDTIVYIRDMLANPLVYNFIYKSNAVSALVNKSIKSSRLCMLNNNGEIRYLGSGWVEDNGIKYSNSSYKIVTKCNSSAYNHNRSIYYGDCDYEDYWNRNVQDKNSENRNSFNLISRANDFSFVYGNKCDKCNTNNGFKFLHKDYSKLTICSHCGNIF